LKSTTAVPAGRTITCPQCKSTFTLAEPAKLISEGSVTLPAPAPKPQPAPAPAPGPRKPVLNDADIVDGADFEFNDKPKGKTRRDDDDFDDRPKSKKRRDDDDDFDDRPKGKKRRDDDDDFDDRPKSKKGHDDDDFDDRDEDRPRKKKTGKKNNKILLLALVGGVGAFALLFILLLILNLTGVFTLFGGGPSSEMMAWAPSNATMMMFVDQEQANKLPNSKDMGKIAEVERFGLTPSEVVSVLSAGQAKSKEAEVSIVKLKTAADKTKIAQKIGGVESSANSKTFFKGSTYSVYFPAPDLAVFATGEATMVSLLQKDNKVTISEDLKAAAGRCKGLMWMAATGPSAEEADFIAMMSGLGEMAGGFGKGNFGPKTAPPKAKVFTMMMTASGNMSETKMESIYDSTEIAKRVRDGMQKMLDTAKEKNKGKENEGHGDVDQSGSTVKVTITGPLDKAKPGGMFGLGF
jgi:hypothetical protein